MRIEYQKLMIENGTYNISCTICLVDILYLPYGLIKTSAALSQPIKNTNSKVRNNGMQSKNPPICLYPEIWCTESSRPCRPNNAAAKYE